VEYGIYYSLEDDIRPVTFASIFATLKVNLKGFVMPIEFCSDIPESSQFWRLFESTGWNDNYHLDPEELMSALRSSWYLLGAYDSEQLVGFGRLVSDGVLHAMIYELIVLPEYQGQGLGGEILEKLVEKCRDTGVRDIQLFCARGKRGFYEKRGFMARPDDAPGMQYIR
jgi:GNAT superfamily N-acetyltransferase